jgi:hypothetical protein
MDKGKTKIVVIGTILGAVIGAASAFILLKRAEDDTVDPKLSAGEGIQVGLGVLGLMRLLAGFGKE